MKNQFMTTQPKDKTDNVQHVDDVIRSGKGSCTVPSSNFPEGVSSCKLFVVPPSLLLVAHGKVHNIQSDTLHGRHLPDGHLKVSVEVVVELDASLSIPGDDDDIMTIKDAVGTFVAWPLNLIQVSFMGTFVSHKKGVQNTKKSIA
ncbi:hypothetical protein JHK82_055380 [Glycine max]|nr:hypothetical protein JHK86_055218 [Glycine max]KAG4917920.1 hypothetical protein JHK85_056201 [Glycine max]KAG5074013.1 hypothetical protein JHK84_055244 [Glycine max]KAG5076685.1 hypothetical protein JHK82_055380 [Glycine max]